MTFTYKRARPRVSVIMSVHNGDKYLREAVDSILHQTFRDFEFIIINDGSTDETSTILEYYKTKDWRIQIFHNENNTGLARNLNKGIELSQGEYIARMDCDDISHPHRLEKQTKFMDVNRTICICGTWCRLLVDGNKNGLWRYPLESDTIRCWLLFNSVFAHPSIFIRRQEIIEKNIYYDPEFCRAQDYEFWARASKYVKLANIDEALILYRIHANQIGDKYAGEQGNFARQVRQKLLYDMGIEPTPTEMDLHQAIGTNNFTIGRDFIKNAEHWLLKIIATNDSLQYYPKEILASVVSQKWFTLCKYSASLGMWLHHYYKHSRLSCYYKITFLQRIRFFSRSLLYRVS